MELGSLTSRVMSELVDKHSLQFIEDHREEPFCPYVPLEPPHCPYREPNDDPSGFRVADGYPGQLQLSGEAVKEEFREMVVSMDHGVGASLGVPRVRDLTQRTLELFLYRCGARHL